MCHFYQHFTKSWLRVSGVSRGLRKRPTTRWKGLRLANTAFLKFGNFGAKNIFGAKFKNGHFRGFDGIGSQLVYRVIGCVDHVSDVYFIPNPFLDGQLGHSKFWREIQKWAFLLEHFRNFLFQLGPRSQTIVDYLSMLEEEVGKWQTLVGQIFTQIARRLKPLTEPVNVTKTAI